MNKGQRLLFVLLTLLLVFLPFHTLVTVWLAKTFGYIYIWSAWKEVIVLFTAIIAFAWILKDRQLRIEILRRPYNKLAIAYIVLAIVYLLLRASETTAYVSFVLHTRFIVVFLVAQVLAWYQPGSFGNWTRLVVILALISAVLGLLQVSLLPANSLEHLGYDSPGTNTAGIPPAIHQVAPESNIYRAQAGLRGPNALGAYLIVPILVCLYQLLKSRSKKEAAYTVILALGLVVTYSRSAWLAVAVTGAIGIAWWAKPAYRRLIAYGSMILVVIVVGLVYVVANTDSLRSVVLHENDEVTAVQSNEGHVEFSQKALAEVVSAPLGEGLGTAGPASALDGQARIAENYFLQVGQEVGWLGIILLVLLHGYVLIALWRLKSTPGAQILLLGLAALTFTNLLLHTWADEAVAITFWALAGVWLGGVGLKDASKRKYKSR